MHVTPIRLLLVEDSDDDAQLVLRELRRSGYEPTTTRVDRAEPFADALREGTWDIILADFNLPTFSGLEALEIYQASGLDIPFLLVSGTVGEETAVSAMIAGAHDYVLKDNLTRLGPAVTRELREYHIRRGRREDHRRVVASERRFTTIFGSSPVATIITDVDDGLILDLNPAALTLTGWRREHVIGRSTTHLGLWRDQAEHRRVVSAALDAGPGHSVERTITPPGRNPLTVLASFALIELDGHGRLLLMMQDITARKAAEETLRESEERYRLLIENSHDLVAELDVEGRFLYASPQYTGTTGYSSAQLLGTRALDYVHPQDRAAMQAHLEQMEESATVRYRFRHHNGSWLSFESGGRAFVRSGGERRAVLITRDLSEQLRADEARKALEAQLREAQKMEAIGTLAGGIAHDFNNILTGIFGYVQLAEMETAADHPARSYLAGIMRSSERARDLVAQILTFSRRREQQRSVGRLAPIVHDALRLLRASLPATIEFRVDLDAQCPPVLCDSTQLHQVVMNLGTNAAYAMRERNGVLTVKLATCRADPSVVVSHPQLGRGPVVCLSIDDTGVGMDAATRDRIFEPFFTTKPIGEGTGLGLAVVHGIVQNHEGAIICDSTPGAGTCFRIYLPPVEDEGVQVSPRVREPSRGRGERVLLVDDEEPVVAIAGRMLERLGYKPHVFTDARRALAELERTPQAYDLLLSDLTMSGITGIDLARRARELRPDFPIIITTGFMNARDIDTARGLGVSVFLEKPFALSALADCLQIALHPSERSGSRPPMPWAGR